MTGKVQDDIQENYKQTGGDVSKLPQLPPSVGGNVDFMIGVKYLRYFPELVFQLPSGLSIYRSNFQNSDGSRGVIGGPHKVFTNIEEYNHLCQPTQSHFVSNRQMIYKNSFQEKQDVPLLEFKGEHNILDIHLEAIKCDNYNQVMLSRQMKIFEQVEEAGSQLNYRCIQCRDCPTCKNHADEEIMSIKEEVGQH